MGKTYKLKNQIGSLLILGAGVFLRLVYVCFGTIYDRQYDIGMIDISAGAPVSGGHLGYIQYLYHNLRLPDMDPTTVYQFHHPPLHHFVSALWMRFMGLFSTDTHFIEESIQIIPLVCSIIILLTLKSIVKEFNLSSRAENFVMAIFAFHPSLILLSGSVNNDCGSLMFTFLTILYTIRWMKKKTTKNILGMALFLGLGISTKQNVAELAFPIAVVFIFALVHSIVSKKGEKPAPGNLLGQYFVFGFVSIPLGMWFYIRNLVKYNVSLTWVYELPKDSWQYVGDYPLINRYLWPIPAEMVDNLKHFKIGCGYNTWMQIIRTSVLGEWDMASVGRPIKFLAVMLMLLGALLAFWAFLSFMRNFLFTKKQDWNKVFFLLTYLTVMAFYLGFSYKYPQECSMNFRYITVTLLFPAVGLGMSYQKTKKTATSTMNILLSLFGICSVAMTAVWCFNL